MSGKWFAKIALLMAMMIMTASVMAACGKKSRQSRIPLRRRKLLRKRWKPQKKKWKRQRSRAKKSCRNSPVKWTSRDTGKTK